MSDAVKALRNKIQEWRNAPLVATLFSELNHLVTAVEREKAEREKELKAPGPPIDMTPQTYAYHYPDGIRYGTGGRVINGNHATKTEPLYSGPQVEAMRAETAKLQAEIAELKAGAAAMIERLIAEHWPIGELGTLEDFRCGCGALIISKPGPENRLPAWKKHLFTAIPTDYAAALAGREMALRDEVTELAMQFANLKDGMAEEKRKARLEVLKQAHDAIEAGVKRWDFESDCKESGCGCVTQWIYNQMPELRAEVQTESPTEAQRKSFAYGNVNISNPAVTRGIVANEASKLKSEEDADE